MSLEKFEICINSPFPPSLLRAVLADRFKGVSEPSEAMILGQMLHKIYQATLNNYHEVDEDVRVMMLEKEIERTVTSLDSLDSL